MTRARHIIGYMTGTSLDGLDAVLTAVTGQQRDLHARFIARTSRPLGPLADLLASIADGNPHPPIDYLRAARQLGEIHVDACRELIARSPAPTDLVVAHGQTIWHAPRDEAGPVSWQLFDPWPIARQLRLPVCYDLRQADLIAGGEGAPLTPVADAILYRDVDAIVNLGGICNVTFLQGDIEGFDLCPCNLLIDRVVRLLFPDRRYDDDGRIARQGRPDPQWFAPIFDRLTDTDTDTAARRSLGREPYPDALIRDLVSRARAAASPHDIVASAVDAVAASLASALASRDVATTVLAGGGARNACLVDRIRHHAASRVTLSDDHGIPCEAREAMGFAILGALSHDGIPITLPHITGADTPGRAGTWVYP